MNQKLRWRIVCIAVVLIASALVLWQKRLTLGLDLKGGVQFSLQVNVDEALKSGMDVSRDEIVEQARQAIDRRVNELGVVEPFIAVQGDNRDRLVVQLPGFTDVARAQAVLGTTARLEWKLVDGRPIEVIEAQLTGRDIRSARAIVDEMGRPGVAFSLTPDGGRRFAALTTANIGRELAIVLDGRVHSTPVIDQAITGGEGSIRGSFTHQEAADLALVLRSGALPVSMTYLGGQYVGPMLGMASIRAGLGASLAGLGLVAAFMLVYYRRAGVNAVLSVVANLLLLLGVMSLAGAALTLPAIAGLILTIGMGVDSNVLIFERIKEELRAGKGVRAAIATGFDRVFLTILDTHVASLVAALFLFQFGTGPIRGFATTLTVGLLTNVFTAVVVSRALFEVITPTGFGRLLNVGSLNLLSWRKPMLIFSMSVVAASLAVLLVRGGLPLGLDFTGGTTMVATFAEPVSEDAVRQAIAGDESVQRVGSAPDRTLLIRLFQSSNTDIQAGVNVVKAALGAARLPAFEIAGSEMIGPAVGADMKTKGAMATIASLTGIAGYIALRFRPSFAAGAMLATVHDIVVTLAMLSACGYDLTLNVVAGVLTIAGYSVNDTIVIFDRVREQLRLTGGSIEQAVAQAVNQTLGRTIITAGTTFLAVLALYMFGGDVLRGFSFAMLVGIVTGTYSTVFVASPVAALLARTGKRL
jgi:SecD/SecF fusion protein